MQCEKGLDEETGDTFPTCRMMTLFADLPSPQVDIQPYEFSSVQAIYLTIFVLGLLLLDAIESFQTFSKNA